MITLHNTACLIQVSSCVLFLTVDSLKGFLSNVTFPAFCVRIKFELCHHFLNRNDISWGSHSYGHFVTTGLTKSRVLFFLRVSVIFFSVHWEQLTIALGRSIFCICCLLNGNGWDLQVSGINKHQIFIVQIFLPFTTYIRWVSES